MKRLLAAAAFAISWSLIAGAANAAAQRPVLCKLVVNGKTYLDGQCLFEADKDGSFRIFGKDYFAYINVHGGTAEASWNADPKSSHAQAPLGTLTRKGACWVNATAQICARNLPPDKLAKAVAAQPKGDMIYPDYPGASQSCIMPRGGNWVEGAPLVLDNCPADKSANRFVRVGGEIRVDGAPNLCAGLVVGAHSAFVELQKCGEAGRQWRSPATSTTSALIRSKEGDCWTIPKIADDKAIFPFEIEADACRGGHARPIKFFFDKG
ncbi:MAG TPA: hypothetical protein VG986_09735 [Pseudolabrys sp.]|nr:hypothetical protein [Pseudolabrys sp.]